MKAAQFRRMALAFPGAIEASHMGHPDFRAGGKRIFATLNADETRGMVSLTPEQQREFIERDPRAFAPASGAWGRQGSTMVALASANGDVVGEAMTCAWQNAQTKLAARSAATRKSKRSRR